jgi:hypothetical protein
MEATQEKYARTKQGLYPFSTYDLSPRVDKRFIPNLIDCTKRGMSNIEDGDTGIQY